MPAQFKDQGVLVKSIQICGIQICGIRSVVKLPACRPFELFLLCLRCLPYLF
jgi:hypothetical protein